MFLSIIGQVKNTTLVRVLEMHEDVGTFRLFTIDTTDVNILNTLYDIQKKGSSYCDFLVTKEEVNGKEVFELLHSSSKVFETLFEENEPPGNYKYEEGSFMSFIRLLMTNNGKIIISDNGKDDVVPEWKAISPTSFRYTNAFGITASYLYPNEPLDGVQTYSWASETILRSNRFDEFNKVSGYRFLVPHDTEFYEFGDMVEEIGEISVVTDRQTIKYRAVRLSDRLPIFPEPSLELLTQPILSRFQFAAAAYSLALKTLSNTIIDDKQIESKESLDGYSEPTGRFVKLDPDIKPNAKQATEMLNFYASTVQSKKTENEIYEFTKTHPYYDPYKTIISSYIGIIAGQEQPPKLKLYHKLKVQESLFNNILNTLKYQLITFQEGLLFNIWTSGDFDTDIPLYKINLSGGGGTWQPPSIY